MIEFIRIDTKFDTSMWVYIGGKFHTQELIEAKPIDDSEFQFFEPHRFDDIIARAKLKCSTEDIDLSMWAYDNDWDFAIPLTYKLYDLVSKEFRIIRGKPEIRDDDIICFDQMEFPHELDKSRKYPDPVWYNSCIEYLNYLRCQGNIIFNDKNIHI